MSLKLVVMGAEWCVNCGPMKKLASEVLEGSEVALELVDIDEHPEVAIQHQVRSIPTSILFSPEGMPIRRHTGAMTKSALQEFIKP